MKAARPKQPSVLRRLPIPRGQAMVEYSFISHALLIGGAFGAWVFVDYFMYALNLYFESVYWIITSPVP